MKYKPVFKYVIKQKRSCHNNCVFCFIDQNPKGLRKSLYFKDDDSRLSFMQGTYITLTNLTEHDIDRIMKTKIPVNVSVHTTNPDLRNRLMGNPKAGLALEILYKFAEAEIPMNCQLVLCPEFNDGDELFRSLSDLTKLKSIKSIACVPVGLTKFHTGGLRNFTKPESIAVIEIINKFKGVFAADELYIKAGIDIPDYGHYGDFPQYENGVGMSAFMKHHFYTEANQTKLYTESSRSQPLHKTISIATGTAAYPLISEFAEQLPHVKVFSIRNDFFGESITVSGLLTGTDVIEQLRGEDLGDMLLLPPNMFNTDGITLDDMTVGNIESALKVKVKIVDKNENLCYYIVNVK